MTLSNLRLLMHYCCIDYVCTFAVLYMSHYTHTQAFAFSRWRLIVLNLEGVLAKATALPELVSVPDELLESLRLLSEEPVNVKTLLQQLKICRF
jgi:hypothetical protein